VLARGLIEEAIMRKSGGGNVTGAPGILLHAVFGSRFHDYFGFIEEKDSLP
jgi:hypothetical protein